MQIEEEIVDSNKNLSSLNYNILSTVIKSTPNFSRLEMVLKRQGEPDRVPFYELYSNIEEKVLGKPFSKEGLTDEEQWEYGIKRHIEHQLMMGYDYIICGANNFAFPKKERAITATKEGERGYVRGGDKTIANREDFEKYPWPKMDEISYSHLEKIEKMLPEGMKAIAQGPGGVLENVMWLLGYEGISYLLVDDSNLVEDMFYEVGSRIVVLFRNYASFQDVGALVLGDDMGFKTQTMLPPNLLRKYVFPWHKKIVEVTHEKGKPIILHSCGNLNAVMEDIIECGWDAKHSFEDAIEPVWKAKQRYGDRIALLGGFDVDKIARMTPSQVREHTRFLIKNCAPGGGWALGTGNSVANYIPVENFIAMIEEGLKNGKYPVDF